MYRKSHVLLVDLVNRVKRVSLDASLRGVCSCDSLDVWPPVSCLLGLVVASLVQEKLLDNISPCDLKRSRFYQQYIEAVTLMQREWYLVLAASPGGKARQIKPEVTISYRHLSLTFNSH